MHNHAVSVGERAARRFELFAGQLIANVLFDVRECVDLHAQIV